MAVNRNNKFYYDHNRWETNRNILKFLIKHIGFNFLAKMEKVEGVENIPEKGAVVLLINHIAFIDPIAVLQLVPRNIVPLAKVEVYNYPVVGIFPKLWGVVPIKRNEIDRRSLQHAMSVLRAGEILLVAPEGTRSHALQNGREGVAYLASRTDAAIVPVAIDGTEGFPTFRGSKRWREKGATIRFGQPFRYRKDLKKARGPELRRMTDEAMYILASLLPDHRRGVYSNLSQATEDTIEWFK